MIRGDDDPRIGEVLAALDTIGAPCECGSADCASFALNDLMFGLLEAISWRGCSVESLREILRAVLVNIPSRELDDAHAVAQDELDAGRRCETYPPPMAPVTFGGAS